MKILIVGSEMVPLAKTGGLGDVLGALPRALAALGHDVRVCIPFYSQINQSDNYISETNIGGEIKLGESLLRYTVAEFSLPNSNSITYLITNDKLFDRAGIYVDPSSGLDYNDNDIRFAFLCKSVIDLVQKLFWQPDILYVHDWQGALTPVYLKTIENQNSFFSKCKSVLTIHNIAYQGKFKKERISLVGLPEEMVRPMGEMEFYGEMNFLKCGITYADKITTVSETYAREIQGEQGCGLDGILQSRSKDIHGILNGVDYKIWSPSIDRLIPYRYRSSNLSGKKMNKVELLNQVELPVRMETPLIGMVSRLVEQKGMKLLLEVADQIFYMNLQMIILGTGDKQIEQELRTLQSKYPDRLRVYLSFDEELAHKIEAGADIFLMPSLFEPCGLNQMYSLKYGTPPIVHKVGGLADTVVNYDEGTGEGTGFVFEQFTSDVLVSTIKRAISVYPKRKKWTKLMKNGMKKDFSWNAAAKKYEELFKTVLS